MNKLKLKLRWRLNGSSSHILCPRSLMGMIFVLRRGDVMSISLEINCKFCKIEYIRWTTGWQLEVSVAADASHSLSVEYLVFIKKIAYESIERHRAKSCSHTRSLANRNLPTLGVWMYRIFTICEIVEFGIEK
jgi:hypothetical protein